MKQDIEVYEKVNQNFIFCLRKYIGKILTAYPILLFFETHMYRVGHLSSSPGAFWWGLTGADPIGSMETRDGIQTGNIPDRGTGAYPAEPHTAP